MILKIKILISCQLVRLHFRLEFVWLPGRPGLKNMAAVCSGCQLLRENVTLLSLYINYASLKMISIREVIWVSLYFACTVRCEVPCVRGLISEGRSWAVEYYKISVTRFSFWCLHHSIWIPSSQFAIKIMRKLICNQVQKAPIVISYWIKCDAHNAKNTRRTEKGP